MGAKKKRMFFPMKDFSSRNVKIIHISTLGSLFCSTMPCHHLSRREESHHWWGEGSNLCCQFSCWDPAGSQMEWAASRVIRLPQLQVTTSLCAMQAKDPGAPALPEHHQSSARTVYCWEGWAAAQQQLQPSFSSERTTNSCCADGRVVASLSRTCQSTEVLTELFHWDMGLTVFENLRNQQDLGAFPWLGNDQTSSHIHLLLSLEISCCPLPKRQEQPILQSSSSGCSVLLSSAISQLSSEP